MNVDIVKKVEMKCNAEKKKKKNPPLLKLSYLNFLLFLNNRIYSSWRDKNTREEKYD